MKSFKEFIEALKDIAKEKAIPESSILEALESALLSAYKKNYPGSNRASVEIDDKLGTIKIFNDLLVVDEYSGEGDEILLKDAVKEYPNIKVGEIIKKPVEVKDFGRIAAQNAKQIVLQKIREAQRNSVLSEFESREGEIVTGTVQRTSKTNVYIDLGKIEGVLPKSEQIPLERYKQGERIRVYILSINSNTREPQVFVSRSCAEFVEKLFELEVPEIQEKIVEIKSIAREAGYRTKIAVDSQNPNIDPLGTCVGQRGIRVQAIVDELLGEKIDIIHYDEDPKVFISKALSPSSVLEVQILDEENKSSLAIVPDNQLSLAIGKEGQNARLAAKLTNWKIDIKSKSQYEEETK